MESKILAEELRAIGALAGGRSWTLATNIKTDVEKLAEVVLSNGEGVRASEAALMVGGLKGFAADARALAPSNAFYEPLATQLEAVMNRLAAVAGDTPDPFAKVEQAIADAKSAPTLIAGSESAPSASVGHFAEAVARELGVEPAAVTEAVGQGVSIAGLLSNLFAGRKHRESEEHLREMEHRARLATIKSSALHFAAFMGLPPKDAFERATEFESYANEWSKSEFGVTKTG